MSCLLALAVCATQALLVSGSAETVATAPALVAPATPSLAAQPPELPATGPPAPETPIGPPSAPMKATGDVAAVAAAEREAALVRVLIAVFNPWASSETRLRALRDPALEDPRAASAVTFLLSDAHHEIRAAAAQVLGKFTENPRVEAALVRTVTDQQEPTDVRVAAVQSLGRVGAAAAGEALVKLTEDDDQDLALRAAARAALETRFPALAARQGGAEVVDRGGRVLLAVGGAVLGSYALGSVGALGRNNAGITIGILGGGLVGAGTAFLLTRSGEITRAQAGWMVSGGMWGAAIGMWTAGIAAPDPSTRLTFSFGLLGEGAALAAAAASTKTLSFTGGDVAFIDLAGLTGVDLVAGTLLMGQGNQIQFGRAALVASGLVGLASGALLARRLEFAHGDRELTVEAAYEGLAAGFLVGMAFDATDRRIEGASLLGLGAGFAGGVALAQLTDHDANDVRFIFSLGSYGKLLGFSIPMLVNAADPRVATGALIGSVASVGAAHLLADEVEFRPGAVPFVALSTAIGFWHGLALGSADESLTTRQQTGSRYLGAALGGLVAIPLVQTIAPTSGEVLALTGGAFWGTWFAAWGAALANTTRSTELRLTLAASDVGLAAAGVLVSPLFKMDSRRIGIANLGGLAGAGLASLAVALATKNDHAVITANLIGSGVGLLGGALLAASLELSPLPSGGDSTGATSRGGVFDHLLAGIATPQVVPLVMTGDPGRAHATTMGFGLAFLESKEPAPIRVPAR